MLSSPFLPAILVGTTVTGSKNEVDLAIPPLLKKIRASSDILTIQSMVLPTLYSGRLAGRGTLEVFTYLVGT